MATSFDLGRDALVNGEQRLRSEAEMRRLYRDHGYAIDRAWELSRKLVEYKKFKDAADKLETMEHTQEDVYPRLPAKQEFEMPEDRGPGLKVSIFDLINAVNDVIKRVEARNADVRHIEDEHFTVADKINVLRDRLTSQTRFGFTELFADAASRNEVVATFLALLEMIRLKQLKIEQAENFGDIMITEGDGQDEFDPVQPEDHTAPAPVND